MRLVTPLFICLLSTPAWAANTISDIVCAPSKLMEQRLTTEFGEKLQGSGLRDPESMVEVWSSERGSWTLVISHARGERCIVAMGDGWDMLEEKDPA